MIAITTLSPENFELAFSYILTLNVEDSPGEYYQPKLPYGYFPGQQTNGGVVPLHEKSAWDRYVWNPPEFDTEHPLPEDNQTPKPTWEDLVGWATLARRIQAIARLDTECTARITAGYGEQTTDAEWQFRFRASEAGASDADRQRLSAGHAERDRLRTRHRAITAWIYTLTDPDILRNLDFSDDEYWSATWTPPE